MQITNTSGINLALAVWLVHDDYDYVDKDNYISVTGLMKPLKQIILPNRIPPEERTSDVADYISRKLGHAIHDSIETSWKKGHRRALKLMGYPQDVIDRILVNPADEDLQPDSVPVYLEYREFRTIVVDGVLYTIGGKFDMVADGILADNKSTSAYSWMFGTRDDDHRLQMSLYRWIDAGRKSPRIKEDICNVNYIFTDWQKAQAKMNANYPQKRVEQKTLPLMSVEETDAWIRAKIRLIKTNQTATEAQMPRCSDKELWRSAPKYKYYSDPEKAKDPSAKSTKNFDDPAAAAKHRADMGKGVVVTIHGEVKACGYCAAWDVCEQRREYFND